MKNSRGNTKWKDLLEDWIIECKSGQLNFNAERRIQANRQIEEVAKIKKNDAMDYK